MANPQPPALTADPRELAAAIRRVSAPERIVLFGSQASGQTRNDSDIDLMVVAPRSTWKVNARNKEIGRLRRALPRSGVPIDLLLYTPEEIERWRDAPNHLIHDALTHGKELYGRP